MRQPSLRELAEKVTERAPATLAVERAGAIRAATASPALAHFRVALTLGRLHLCGNCAHFAFGPEPAGPGLCSIHGDGLLAFAMPFDCRDFAVSNAPTAPDFLPKPSALEISQ
jgi:hypothetical protein